MKKFRQIQFRVSRRPRLELPLGARSVGHYAKEPGEFEKGFEKNFVQVFWCVKGSGEFEFRGKQVLVMPNHVFAYSPGDRHLTWSCEDGFEYRWWTMDGPLAAEVYRAFGLDFGESIYAGPPPVELFERLTGELKDVSLPTERKASATAYALLAAASGQAASGPEQQTLDPVVGQAVKIFVDSFAEPALSVENVARDLKIHRSALSRRFSQALGISPVQYLKSIRMQRALTMLKESDLSVADIAYAVGFSDPNYFSRAVSEATGMPPRQFRKA